MLDRGLKLIVTLTLLMFLMQTVMGVLTRALAVLLAALVSSVADASSFFGGIVAAVLALAFVVGLFARVGQLIANRNPRLARERASRDRAVRQRVRRPAEGV